MKPPRRIFTLEERERIRDMLLDGDSVRTIADYMNVPIQTIYSIERRTRLTGTELRQNKKISKRTLDMSAFDLPEIYRFSTNHSVEETSIKYNVSKTAARKLVAAAKEAFTKLTGTT